MATLPPWAAGQIPSDEAWFYFCDRCGSFRRGNGPHAEVDCERTGCDNGLLPAFPVARRGETQLWDPVVVQNYDYDAPVP